LSPNQIHFALKVLAPAGRVDQLFARWWSHLDGEVAIGTLPKLHNHSSPLEPPYTDLTYLPMQEVLKYLRANGYKTFIATGGSAGFIRVYSEQVYGILPDQVRHIASVYLRLRQGRPADPDQGAEVSAQQSRGRKDRELLVDVRAPAACGVR
jgi:hypothetical protein